jgi:hypothetical protein
MCGDVLYGDEMYGDVMYGDVTSLYQRMCVRFHALLYVRVAKRTIRPGLVLIFNHL